MFPIKLKNFSDIQFKVKEVIIENMEKEKTFKFRNRKTIICIDQEKSFIVGLSDYCPRCGE